MKVGLLVLISTCFAGIASAAQVTDSAQLYFTIADSSFALRNFRIAQFNFEQALRLRPNFEQARLRYATMLGQRNQYEAARLQLKTALVANPSSRPVVSALFYDAVAHRRWVDAIEYGKKIQQQQPVADTVYAGLAQAYYNQEDYSSAIASLTALLSRRPDVKNYILLAKCQADISDYKASASAFQSALNLDPKNATTWYEYSLVLSGVPDLPKAIVALEKGVEMGLKQTMDVRENLANLYLQTADYSKGIVLIDSLLVQKPKDDELMFLAAQALYRNKKYKAAGSYYERAYQTDPENFRALYMLGMSFQRDGKQNKGEELCNQAIAADPSLQKMRTVTY